MSKKIKPTILAVGDGSKRTKFKETIANMNKDDIKIELICREDNETTFVNLIKSKDDDIEK